MPANTHHDLAVECRALTKEFGQGEARVRALRGIDLDVYPGEMTLLVGPSGCGKTTLISIIAGLLAPTAGEVRVLGTELFRLPGRAQVAFRGRNVGFVFQQYNLLPALTAAENAAVPLLVAGRPRRPSVARAAALLGELGMADRAQALPAELSGGQQQRVAIARALIHEPRLLVCDEPTAALDAHTGQTVMQQIRQVAVRPGRAVIVVTHDNRVFGFGDRIVHMNDGRVERVETAGEFAGPFAHLPANGRRVMFRKYLLPLVSLGLLLFAVSFVARGARETPMPPPPIEPARAPYGRGVAGAGLVEARTENIAVGSALPGVVTEVFVRVGQTVKAGAPLFRLDDRQLRAELKYRESSLAAAEAQLARLERMPRAEELPPLEAQMREAEANVADQEDQYKRAKVLSARQAVADEEMNRRTMAYRMARQQLLRVKAQYDLLKAGAWEPDKAVARAGVCQARAQVAQTRTDLDRLVVRALVDGDVLQVNVRPGEFVGAPPNQALVVLGDVHRLHVRVDIDEHDIPRFRPGAPGQASVRGHPQEVFPLTFVRVEPYVVPKKSLTGDNTERVDTRVLQVIYAIDTKGRPLYVGQQMDVFLEAGPAEGKQ